MCDDDYDIDNVDPSKSDNEKCTDMLMNWLTDPNASYQKLFDALKQYDLSSAVEEIKKEVLTYVCIYVAIKSCFDTLYVGRPLDP